MPETVSAMFRSANGFMTTPARFFTGLLCVLTLGFCSADEQPAATTRYVIRGPEKVVDGWVSTDGKQSFAGKSLRLNGRPWADYERVPFRFDLKPIDPARHGQLKRATLRLHALQAENKQGLATVVSAASVSWYRQATFSSPDGQSRWPADRNRAENPDYAAITLGQVRHVIGQPGPVEFDVTEIVEGWLFQNSMSCWFFQPAISTAVDL